MADVLIRGMEMPESCDKCRLFNECWCMALGIEDWRKSYNKPPEGERLLDCPLVPLPEGHGRLIDADAFCRFVANNSRIDEIISAGIISYVNAVPTIVQAEGGNADGV